MISSEIFIEGVADDACERASYVIFIELFDSHDRSVILSREPTAALAVVSHRSRLRLSRAKACFTLHSACTMFSVVEDFALGVATGGGDQIENVMQEFADSLTKVCFSHATTGAVTHAANFVELKVRARYFPFRSLTEKRKRVLIVGWCQS